MNKSLIAAAVAGLSLMSTAAQAQTASEGYQLPASIDDESA